MTGDVRLQTETYLPIYTASRARRM